MPNGKAAGELCANLDPVNLRCRIWGQQDYPDFCRGFQPDVDFCGKDRDQAMQILSLLEVQTSA